MCLTAGGLIGLLAGIAWQVHPQPWVSSGAETTPITMKTALTVSLLLAGLLTVTVGLAQAARRRAQNASAHNAVLTEDITALQAEIQDHLRAEALLTAQRGELTAQQEELEQSKSSLAQMNALLAQASGRFQELFQGLPVACVCYDRQGRIMEWNRAFERLYGQDQLLGLSFRQIVDPDEEAPQIGEAILAVLEGNALEGIEWSHRRADGSEAHLYCSLFPLRGPDGEIIGGISTDVDISAQKQAEDALRESEERLHALYNTTSQQSLSFEEKTTALLAMGCAQFGVGTGALVRSGAETQEVIQALAPKGSISDGEEIPAGQSPIQTVLERLRGAGAEPGAEVSISAPVRVTGEAWGTLCFAGVQPEARLFTSGDRELVRLMAQWIGGEIARRQAEEAMRESEERFRTAISSMSEGLILMDTEGTVRLCNESAESILRMTRSEIHGWRPLNSDFHAVREDGAPFPEGSYPLVLSMRNGQPQQDVVMGLPRQGAGMVWVSVNSKPLFRDGSQTPYAIVATFSDITERRRCEDQIAAQMVQIKDYTGMLESQKAQLEATNAQLEALARQDSLTSLNNRRAFEERLELELGRAERYKLPLSLILLDVDRFKQYNDTFGHQAGDEVLRMLAQTLAFQGRDTDFFARYGGEEFIVLLPHTESHGATILAERLRASLETLAWPWRSVTASFGVATLQPAMQDQTDLIQEADAALYAAKTLGRNRVVHAQSLAVPVAAQA